MEYLDCDDPKHPEIGEKQSEEVVYLVPDTQRFLEIRSRYMVKSKELQVIFFVEFNSANICWSRASPEERANGVWDDEVFEDSETCEAVNVGASGKKVQRYKLLKVCRFIDHIFLCVKVTLSWDKPCKGKSESRCPSIYFRLEGVDSGQGKDFCVHNHKV